MILPLLLITGGVVAVAILIAEGDRPVPVHEPDLPAAPVGQTKWKRVNEILPELAKAANSSGIPLGLIVGWIARESGGKLAEHPQPGPGDTKYDERGYFQLMPEESESIGYNHEKLSTDPFYSINAGLALIGKYMGVVDGYGIFAKGSKAYWLLNKLTHSMGSGDVGKIVAAAKAAGRGATWDDFEAFARSGAAKTKHSPAKWLDFVDSVYQVGKPFGFGNEQVVVGGQVFGDIPDPLDLIAPR